MTVNWDALTGIALFLGGTWLALGVKVAGGLCMILGALYLARALSVKEPG